MALYSNKKKILTSFDPVGMRWSKAEVRKSGKKPVFSSAVPDWKPAENGGADLYCSLATSRTHLLLADFPRLKKELLSLQINERIRQEGLYGEDIHFIQKIKKIGQQGDTQKLSVVSMPFVELAPLLDPRLTSLGLRVRRIVPAPVAIAGLLGQFTTEPVLAAIFSAESLQVLLVQDKRPIYSQMIPPDVSGLFEEAMLAQTFEVVRQNIRRLFSLEVDRFICLGSHYEECPPRIGGEEPWQPDWQLFLEAGSVKDLYRYPELYGTWFADPAYDFLPRSWQISYAAQQWGNVLCTGLLLGAVGLGVLTFDMHSGLDDLRATYKNLYDDLFVRQQELATMLPPEQEKQMVERIAALQATIGRLPRLEDVLAIIGNTLPQTVKIASFTYRAGSNSSMARPVTAATAGGNRSTTDDLEARITGLLAGQGILHLQFTTRGSLRDARTRFQNTISGLAEKFVLEHISWNYVQESNRGFLECDLKLARRVN